MTAASLNDHPMIVAARRTGGMQRAALGRLHPSRRAKVIAHPGLADMLFNEPRFHKRLALRTADRLDLPPPSSVGAGLGKLILCSDEALAGLVQHVGLLMCLKQLPPLLTKGDIESLKESFGPSVVSFAMTHRALAPAWPFHEVRLPQKEALAGLIRTNGWAAVLQWARAGYGESARWMELRLPPALCETAIPEPVQESAVAVVDQAVETLLAEGERQDVSDGEDEA